LGTLGASRGFLRDLGERSTGLVYGTRMDAKSSRSIGRRCGVRFGVNSPDIQVAEEVVVLREVEVKTRVNPLPSYPPEYEMMYSAQELAQIQADIEECEREAVESGRISTHWPRTPVLGSPRSPVVDQS